MPKRETQSEETCNTPSEGKDEVLGEGVSPFPNSEISNTSELVKYYLIENHLVSRRAELLKQMGLLFVSLGALLYVQPAAEWNEKPVFEYQDVIAMPLGAAIILYNATDIFINKIRSERIPKELQNILINPKTRLQRYGEYILIGIVSCISAVPLTTTGFTYYIINNIFYLLAKAAFVQFCNTILHFLPVKLMLQEPLYRAPILPVELSYRWIKICTATQQKLYERAFLKHKENNQRQLKQLLVDVLNRTEQKIIQKDFKYDWRKIRFTSKIPDRFTKNLEKESDYNQLLIDLCQHHQFHSAVSTQADNRWYSLITRTVNSGIRKLLYGVGGFWVAFSLIGYLADPFNELAKLSGSYTVATALAVPASYSLGVLFFFFGANMLRDLYDYMTYWGETDTKIPLEVKLYPKTFMLLSLFNIYITIFSPPAAKELIVDNFKGEYWEPYQTFLLWICRTGVPFLVFFATNTFNINILRKWAIQLGGDDSKMAARLIEKNDLFKDAIFWLDGDTLEKNLKENFNTDQRKALLNIEDKEFNELLDHEGTFNQKIPFRFFPVLKKECTSEVKKLIPSSSDSNRFNTAVVV